MTDRITIECQNDLVYMKYASINELMLKGHLQYTKIY